MFFLTKIWDRYFFREIVQTTLFFLFTFYGLYVLIDYANHAATLHRYHIPFRLDETALYYLCELFRRLNILLPFALLLATIKTLCRLNAQHELIALMASGVSIQRLLQPLLLVGIICTGISYLNTEMVLPLAQKELKKIEDKRSNASRKHRPHHTQAINLEDNSILIFQSFDTDQQRFVDAYWIRNSDEIYRMKYLYPPLSEKPPTGHYVDKFERNKEGDLVVKNSLPTLPLPKLQLRQETLFETLSLPEEQSISELYSKLPHDQAISEKESQVVAHYAHKLILPWLCLLAVIGPAPFCLRISRNLPVFFIYAGGIFCLVAFNLIMNAAVLLTRRQTLSVFVALWLPFLLISSVLSWRYLKTR